MSIPGSEDITLGKFHPLMEDNIQRSKLFQYKPMPNLKQIIEESEGKTSDLFRKTHKIQGNNGIEVLYSLNLGVDEWNEFINSQIKFACEKMIEEVEDIIDEELVDNAVKRIEIKDKIKTFFE